jgi:hypothetical protein
MWIFKKKKESKAMEVVPDFKPQAPMELKIKALSLAAEARIIKAQQERLLRRQRKAAARPRHNNDEAFATSQSRRLELCDRIRDHRKHDIRLEARATNLARGFLKGLAYEAIEATTYEPGAVVRALSKAEGMVKEYGEGDSRIIMQKFAMWRDGALTWAANHPAGVKSNGKGKSNNGVEDASNQGGTA